MRLPSTLMICCAGSTLAPNRRTIWPSTSTRPSPISSSQCLRLPSPAAASTFCRRIPSGPSGSIRVSVPSSSSWLIVLLILDILGQERRELGQLVQAGQAEPLKEIGRGPVQDRAGLRLGRLLLHQPAQREGADHAVTVDAAHR